MHPPPIRQVLVKDKGQDKDTQIITIRLCLCLLMEAEWGVGAMWVGSVCKCVCAKVKLVSSAYTTIDVIKQPQHQYRITIKGAQA
jgi:hypothetical protein